MFGIPVQISTKLKDMVRAGKNIAVRPNDGPRPDAASVTGSRVESWPGGTGDASITGSA